MPSERLIVRTCNSIVLFRVAPITSAFTIREARLKKSVSTPNLLPMLPSALIFQQCQVPVFRYQDIAFRLPDTWHLNTAVKGNHPSGVGRRRTICIRIFAMYLCIARPHAAGSFIAPSKYKTTFIAIYQNRLLHLYGK